MSLNSQQRLIFVYLRDKDDNRSCTPAGAKLTNEYTHWTNKNDPCTVSVIPSQLCTFFRKRTDSSEVSFDSSEVSFDSSEVLFDSSEEILLISVGIFYCPASYLEILPWRRWSITKRRPIGTSSLNILANRHTSIRTYTSHSPPRSRHLLFWFLANWMDPQAL